jgi:hypothetical protein
VFKSSLFLFSQTFLQNLRQFPDFMKPRVVGRVCHFEHIVNRDCHRNPPASGVDNSDIAAEAIERAGF